MHEHVISIDTVNSRQDNWLLSVFHFFPCVLTVFILPPHLLGMSAC